MTGADPAEDPRALTVAEIFANGPYLVPIYQRAYAWGAEQIETLLTDVHDYRERLHSNYHIGSLVTHARSVGGSTGSVHEVVDGQQRLTTLFIILSVLRGRHPVITNPAGMLTYEGRERSTGDLARLGRDGVDWLDETDRLASVDDLQDFGVKVAVETVRAAFRQGMFSGEDLAYLLDHVRIIHTALPPETDLNHYFEVMNSRGEQLEKHEIVKAHLLGLLTNENDRTVASRTLAAVWDACSDMSRHVQAKFGPAARSMLFGKDTWDEIRFDSFDDLVSALRPATDDTTTPTRRSIGDLLTGRDQQIEQYAPADDSEAARYGAIIDFPNFLLHALSLTRRSTRPFTWDPDGGTPVPLDDKQLVREFKTQLTTAEQVKDFAVVLLRARYLFDRYVVKVDRLRANVEDDSNWVLQRARKRVPTDSPSGSRSPQLAPISTFGSTDNAPDTRENRHVLMLQSMFQVTDGRRTYKNFLYAILEFVYRHQGETSATEFIEFLRALAAARYRETIRPETLDSGTSVPRFVLNYLDYLLWTSFTEGSDTAPDGVDVDGFRFRYRTSVEHFYPQHPDAGSNIEILDASEVDRFGNLCLMTRSENSKRSNLAPLAKINQYRSSDQSLKFQIMAANALKNQTWSQPQIQQHGRDMRRLIEHVRADPATPRERQQPPLHGYDLEL